MPDHVGVLKDGGGRSLAIISPLTRTTTRAASSMITFIVCSIRTGRTRTAAHSGAESCPGFRGVQAPYGLVQHDELRPGNEPHGEFEPPLFEERERAGDSLFFVLEAKFGQEIVGPIEGIGTAQRRK